jgi:integrase
MLEHLPGSPEPDRAMALMALFTGQRLTDLRMMTWSQIEDRKVHYQSTKTRVEGLAIHEAPPELMRELAALKDAGNSAQYIFANPKTGRPFSPNAIRRHIKWACDAAGVPHFTPHQIRHQATTLGLELTGDSDLVEKWIGWLSPEMIRTTYGHLGRRTDTLMEKMAEEITRLRTEIRAKQCDAETHDNVVSLAAWRRPG